MRIWTALFLLAIVLFGTLKFVRPSQVASDIIGWTIAVLGILGFVVMAFAGRSFKFKRSP